MDELPRLFPNSMALALDVDYLALLFLCSLDSRSGGGPEAVNYGAVEDNCSVAAHAPIKQAVMTLCKTNVVRHTSHGREN